MSLLLDGQYRLVRAAGTGGTANVYLAESTATGEKVAVKVLKKALAGQEDMLGRFRREASLLERVQHPNIVKLIRFAQAPEGLLLVMEWAEGTRLDELAETRALSPVEARQVLLQVAGALGAIHAEGIVHRDVKPENIIVERRSGAVRARLLDFGIARFQAGAGHGTFVSMVGQVAGTPSFLSPEQLSGEPADARSDVYSFGVMAYRLLSGRLPFVASSEFEVMKMQVSDPPPPLAVTDELFAPWAPVVLRCLEKRRAARPADGAALRALLEAPPAKKKSWWPLG